MNFRFSNCEQVKLTSADQTVAKMEIGFDPKVSLDEGIRKTVEWYRSYQEELQKN